MKKYLCGFFICGMFWTEIFSQTTNQGQNTNSGMSNNQTVSQNSPNNRNPKINFRSQQSPQNGNYWNNGQNGPGPQAKSGPSGKNWNSGPSTWTSGNFQGGPPTNFGPPNNNWKNGPPNTNSGPPSGNWNNGGPPNGNWNGGPPNGNWNGGPPNGNWNGGPPNPNNGPPNGNWNRGPPNTNNGPPNGNWNGGPPNGNWNGGPPNTNNGPPNGNWNNGPPYGNWNNGPPNGNQNGPPYSNWNQGPPPVPGIGLPLIDPDLPDGLDTMYQRMQAMQAMHEVNQYAGQLGAYDIIPPMAFPHPVPVPGMSPIPPGPPGPVPGQPGTGSLSGFPMRPHSRVDVWANTNPKTENNTGNLTMAFSRRNSESPDTLRPKLAEFQHQGSIGWGNQNGTNNSSGINGTQNQPQQFSNLPHNYPYNPYSYGYNTFGYNPWMGPYQPDIPDHLENRRDNETKFIQDRPPYNPSPASSMPRERWAGLAQSNQTGVPQPSEIMSQGVKNVQRIQTEISSQGWPSQGQSQAGQWTPSSRRNDWNIHGTKKPDPDGEKGTGGGGGGDIEKEVDKEKEESKTKTNMNVIKAVLDEVYRQRNNKDLSVSSIMDAINNRETRYKMQYRYEGNVAPPSWTQQLENVEPKKKEPEPTPKPAEFMAEKVNRTSIPRTGASFRFSSKYIPQNFANIQNPRVQPIHNFPTMSQNPRAQANQNVKNTGWSQTTAGPLQNSKTSAPIVQTQDIIQQAIGIAQSRVMAQANNDAITDLTQMFGEVSSVAPSPTTQKVISMNVDTEITIQKEGKVHVVNHEQVITVPINTSTPLTLPQNQMGVTMAVMESLPKVTKSPTDSVQKVPVPVEDSLSPSSTFGIIVGIIIGFTIILGPIICILCRVRRRHREKKRKLSAKNSGGFKPDAEAMETMLTCDFGDPKPSTSIGLGAKAKVKSFLTKPPRPEKPCTELQTLKPKSNTVTAIIH